MLASSLRSPAVGVKVDVADRLPDAEAADDERLAVGMDHVNVVGVRLVKSDFDVVPLEERTCRVQT